MYKKNVQIKILVIGDCNTGKSSLVKKITQTKFNYKTSIPTFGIHYHNKIIKYNNYTINLDFFDISGSIEYVSLFEIYIFEIDFVFLCFDVTEIDTIHSIDKYWIPEIINKQNSKLVTIYLIGTKTDLDYNHNIVTKLINNIVKKYKIKIKIIFFSNKDELFNLIEIINTYCKFNNINCTKSKKKKETKIFIK